MDAIEGTPESRALLGEWMDEDRRRQRLRWSNISKSADMSAENLRAIRQGRIRITVDASDRIEDALGWERGSVRAAVLEGIRPVARADEAPPHTGENSTAQVTSREEGRYPEWTEVDERRFRLLEQLFESWGEEMTSEKVQVVLEELQRRLVADSPQRTGTRSDQSPQDSDVSLGRPTRK